MKLRRALIASLAPGVVLALSLAGCGDLLGLKDLEPYPADGSTDSSEDSSPDGTTGDTGVIPTDGAGGDGHDAMGPGDGGSGDGTPGPDAPEDTSEPIDSSMGHDSSTGPDSSMGVDSSTGMDSSTAEDTSTGPDSSCTLGSSHDCGSCGHDCLGGSCSGGLCQPFTLATSVTGYDMVVSNGTLFWVDQVPMSGTTSGNVWTCTISNNHCTPGTFATGQNTPERIALGGVGNGTVFWSDYGSGTTNDGTIMSLPLAGGTPATLASGLWIPQGVGADATYLFWVQSYSPTNNPTLTRLTLGTTTTGNLLTGAGSFPTAVAVGGGTVYWSNDLTTNGTVNMSPEDSLSLGTVDNGQSAPYAISVDSTYVYWVDYTAMGSVWQYTISTLVKRAVGMSQNYPVRVVSDSTHAYWIDEGTSGGFNGSLIEWDVASSSSVTRASGLARPSSLAMDSNAVYFTSLDDSSLYMMVR